MKTFLKAIALILLPVLALAQSAPPSGSGGSGGSSGGGGGGYTTASMNLFVSPLGNDSGDCTFTGASACLTLQGAIDKVPKLIRHPVVITLEAGSYAGAKIDGFRVAHAATTSGAALTIQGTLATATLGAGPATGTATGGTRGSETATPSVHATVTASGGWTTNALRGYFLALTGGPGAGDVKAIESNTGTTIAAAGRFTAIPTTATTFAIQEAASVISSGATRNADLILGTSTAGIILQNNDFPPATLLIQRLKFTAVGSYAIYMQTPTNVLVRYSNFSPGGTSNGITVLPGGGVDVLACTWPAITSSSYIAIHQASRVTAFAMGVSEISLSSSVFAGSGGSFGGMADLINGALYAPMNYGVALQKGIWIGNNAGAYLSGNYFDTVVQYCVSTSLGMYPGGTTVTINGDNFTSCGKAIYATGRAFVHFTSVATAGSLNTQGIYIEDGARVHSDFAGYKFTSTTDITIKTLGADVTSTATAFRALTPKVLLDANTLTGITEL